jgi:acyl-CoA thioester hydrolase
MNEPIKRVMRPRVTAEQVLMLPETHRADIPEDYLDSMGHMNVMWYTHLFSCGVGGAFRMVGLTGEYFRENQAGSFALRQLVHYLAEVHVGQSVAIHSRFLGRSARRLHLMHFMLNHSTGLVAACVEGITMHIDMRIRRGSHFPAPIAAAIDDWTERHQQLPWEAPLCGILAP